jgi:hypothetical protein
MTEELNNALAVERSTSLSVRNHQQIWASIKISAFLSMAFLLSTKVQVDPEKLNKKVAVEHSEDEAEKPNKADDCD